MSLVFEPTTHSYKSIDASDTTIWTSVTTLIGHLKQPFDSNAVAKKSAANKKGKWYGMSVEQIQAAWKKESDRACSLGNWYHDQREEDITGCKKFEELPVNAQNYVRALEKMSNCRISAIGVGPARDATIVMHDMLG